MPELPEVETVCRGLDPHITNKTINNVNLYRDGLRFPFPENFANKLIDQKVTSITRRSKYIEINLENKHTWITHLGMTGVFLLCENDDLKEKHIHMLIDFGDIKLKYVDPRRFGYMDILETETLNASKYYKDLGPEPFSAQFNEEYVLNKLKKSNKPIKTLLMDNSFVVGVGNIYANEILFKLKIHPETKAKKLLTNKSTMLIAQLITQITDTLNEAIRVGGSTISDFKAPNSSAGYFPMAFNVYGREKQECMVCKCQILKITQAGRSSFYCPNCQKQ